MSYKLNDFYIGQRVRVRNWDEMVSEYGLTSAGHIDSPIDDFPKEWAPYCGDEGVVIKIDGDVIIADGIPITGLYWTDVEPVEDVASNFSVGNFMEMLGVK